MQVWNVLHAARCKWRTPKSRQKSPSGHHRPTLSGYIFATEARIDNRKKLLSSNTSSTCPYSMVNFGPLAAEIISLVWGTPANFNGHIAHISSSIIAYTFLDRYLHTNTFFAYFKHFEMMAFLHLYKCWYEFWHWTLTYWRLLNLVLYSQAVKTYKTYLRNYCKK